MKKLLAILLILFGLYSTILSSVNTFHYISVFLFQKDYYTIAETNIVSWLLIITRLLETITLFLISHYGASSLLKIRREYESSFWLYIGISSVVLHLIEYILWAMPLRAVAGYTPKYTFIENLVDIFSNIGALKSNITLFITFAIFFGLFSIYKKDASK